MELDRSTQLAYERTWLAEERTMQAWVRTATSLISFGFAIYSFFALQGGAGHDLSTHWGPLVFSIMLIAMGLTALLGAVLQRRQAIKLIEVQCPSAKRFSLAEIIAIAIGGIGIFGLIAILLRK
jgi:putative membrane protein